jgi:hypothetical protein
VDPIQPCELCVNQSKLVKSYQVYHLFCFVGDTSTNKTIECAGLNGRKERRSYRSINDSHGPGFGTMQLWQDTDISKVEQMSNVWISY